MASTAWVNLVFCFGAGGGLEEPRLSWSPGLLQFELGLSGGSGDGRSQIRALREKAGEDKKMAPIRLAACWCFLRSSSHVSSEVAWRV